jgi:transcriptional regulator GlxA family with amidase domain
MGDDAQTIADNFAGQRRRPDIAPDLRVGFILAPRFTLIAFASFIDSLRHAADEADRSRQIHCTWCVIASDLDPVVASCGVPVVPTSTFADPQAFDYIAVVGGLLPACLDLPGASYDYLRAAHAKGVPLAGLCTGSFILANAGFLDDRDCAVHIEHRRHLEEMFPRVRPVTDRVYVRDGTILTCPGGTAAIDLAYALIEEHCGRARAVKSLMSLLVEKNRATHHLPHRPYQNLAACGDWRVERSIELIEQHALSPFTIQELARRIGSSTRELNRAFARITSERPGAIWRKIRLNHAHWMLLNTHRSVTQIALECGFADSAHFSRWFRREYGQAPSTFRKSRRVSTNAIEERSEPRLS